MRKTLFSTLKLTAFAALLCAGCTDVQDDGNNGNSRAVDSFLGLYTVTFRNTDYGNGTVPAAMTVIPGDSVKLPAEGNMRMDGYGFGGWGTNSDGSGTNYAAGSSYKPTGNVTLYAKWIQQYYIYFNSNDGKGTVPANMYVMPGDSVTLPKGDGLTRDGYDFGGWQPYDNWNPASDSIYNAGSFYTPTKNISMRARWYKIITVTFDANGGSVSPASGTTSGGKLASLPTPTRNGFFFGGWYTGSYFSMPRVTTNTIFNNSENTTIYAWWRTCEYETFTDGRDGKNYNKVTIGSQVWMAENLNYDIPDNTTDRCFGNDVRYCGYGLGRLYNWLTVMNGSSSSPASPSGVQGVCPAGWHLPSAAEWDTLVSYAGDSAGTKLISTLGWGGNVTDEYGFSALPNGSNWWSATEADNNGYARSRKIATPNMAGVSSYKTDVYSVRCVAN